MEPYRAIPALWNRHGQDSGTEFLHLFLPPPPLSLLFAYLGVLQENAPSLKQTHKHTNQTGNVL